LRCEVDQITCTPVRVKCSFAGFKRKNYVRQKHITVLKFTKRFLSTINLLNCHHLKSLKCIRFIQIQTLDILMINFTDIKFRLTFATFKMSNLQFVIKTIICSIENNINPFPRYYTVRVPVLWTVQETSL